jgi:hypothetical protein
VLFGRCLGRLLEYAHSRGYSLQPRETGVAESRKSATGDPYRDGVHMRGSLHYLGLATDTVLLVDGVRIVDSHHLAYIDLGSFWEGLDPLCAWGGRFRSPDGNHFSVRYSGRA